MRVSGNSCIHSHCTHRPLAADPYPPSLRRRRPTRSRGKTRKQHLAAEAAGHPGRLSRSLPTETTSRSRFTPAATAVSSRAHTFSAGVVEEVAGVARRRRRRRQQPPTAAAVAARGLSRPRSWRRRSLGRRLLRSTTACRSLDTAVAAAVGRGAVWAEGSCTHPRRGLWLILAGVGGRGAGARGSRMRAVRCGSTRQTER